MMNRRNLFKSLAAAPLVAVPLLGGTPEVPVATEAKPVPGLPEGLYKVRTKATRRVEVPESEENGDSYSYTEDCPGASMTLDLGEIVNLRDNRRDGSSSVKNQCGVTLPGCLYIEIFHEDFDGLKEEYAKHRSKHGNDSSMAAVSRR